MKKVIALLTAILLLASCAALAAADSHILVAYFSATGTTRSVAEKLAGGG